jgi:hypothetical protein
VPQTGDLSGSYAAAQVLTEMPAAFESSENRATTSTK